MLDMVRNDVNIKDLRARTNVTLSSLSDLSGYSISCIARLENEGKGAPKMKEKITSILLEREEEGLVTEVKMWRDRALRAEEKLAMVKASLTGWIKRI